MAVPCWSSANYLLYQPQQRMRSGHKTRERKARTAAYDSCILSSSSTPRCKLSMESTSFESSCCCSALRAANAYALAKAARNAASWDIKN